MTDLTPDGDVTVEGHLVGRLKGLTFEPALDARTLEGKAVRGAALAAIRPMLVERLGQIAGAPSDAFTLNDDGDIEFGGNVIARLAKGPDWMSPGIELVGAAEVEPSDREAARARVSDWLKTEMTRILPTHWKLRHEKAGDTLEGLARGLAFRILESGASVDLRQDDPGARLTPEQREALKALGLRAGRVAAHAPDAQKPAAQRLIAILRAVQAGAPFPLAPEGAGSFPLDGTWPEEALAANGYLRFGRRAVRADLAERLGWEIAKRRKEADKNAFAIPIDLASVVSCPSDDWPAVLKGFGLAPAEKDKETEAVLLWRYAARARPDDRPARAPREDRSRGRQTSPDERRSGPQSGGPRPARTSTSHPRHTPPARTVDPDSPFAALAALLPPTPPAREKSRRKRKPKGAGALASPAFTYTPFQ